MSFKGLCWLLQVLNYFKQTHICHTKSVSALKYFLQRPGLIDWSQPINFTGKIYLNTSSTDIDNRIKQEICPKPILFIWREHTQIGRGGGVLRNYQFNWQYFTHFVECWLLKLCLYSLNTIRTGKYSRKDYQYAQKGASNDPNLYMLYTNNWRGWLAFFFSRLLVVQHHSVIILKYNLHKKWI